MLRAMIANGCMNIPSEKLSTAFNILLNKGFEYEFRVF